MLRPYRLVEFQQFDLNSVRAAVEVAIEQDGGMIQQLGGDDIRQHGCDMKCFMIPKGTRLKFLGVADVGHMQGCKALAFNVNR
ncbi:MAG: hypothetical protein BGO06_00625 [Shinella sp. 65-6]|nr:MAG: hypothetical protein BGO06_00625 [Shinella sp. 65-6]